MHMNVNLFATFRTSVILDHLEQLFAESPGPSLRYLSVSCLFSREHLNIWRHIGQYKQTLPFGDRPRDTVVIKNMIQYFLIPTCINFSTPSQA